MPKIEHWRTEPEEELARLVPTNELTDFWTSNIDIVVGPGESAVIIKDGSIEEVLTQQRVKNLAGGFSNWLGEKLQTKEQFDMLMVDNKPFQVELGVDGLTLRGHRDGQGLADACRLVYAYVPPAHVGRILGGAVILNRISIIKMSRGSDNTVNHLFLTLSGE